MSYIHKIPVFLFALAMAWGCSHGVADGTDIARIEPEFTATKAPGNFPEGTTFGFTAYAEGSTEPADGVYGWGTYYYSSAYRSFVPCAVDPATGLTDGVYAPSYAMKLKDITHDIYMHTPGLPLESRGGSWRIRYARSTNLQVTATPIKLTLTTNYQVYDISEQLETTTMRSITSKFSFEFIQNTDENVSVFDYTTLLNVGTAAYYHPSLDINSIEGQTGSSESLTTTITGLSGQDAVLAKTNEVVVFPSDYTSGILLEPTLSFVVMVGPDARMMNVPLAINAKSNTNYVIRIKISSKFLTVSYVESSWENGGNNVGSPVDIGTFSISGYPMWDVEDWEEGGNSGDIL